MPDRARQRLVPLRRAGRPLLPAPAGQGRLAGVRGREVLLRRRDPAAGRARRRPGGTAAPDPQGPGAAGPVRAGRGPAPHHGHQAPRRPVPGGAGHGLGRGLAPAVTLPAGRPGRPAGAAGGGALPSRGVRLRPGGVRRRVRAVTRCEVRLAGIPPVSACGPPKGTKVGP
ncbi:hypothetical protein SGPA1_30997 [Streptomyces misionensis JCM 4497]